MLSKLRLDQAEGQASPVDGSVQPLERERQAADVVFVAMREDDADHLALAMQQVGDVGEHEIDPEHVLLRKHQPRVDDQDLALPLERPHVDPDLAEAAQRNVEEAFRTYNRRSCSDSALGATTATGGGGGASSWSRYRLSWSKSCSRSATSEPLCSAAAGW